MRKIFAPDEYINNVFELDFKKYYDQGFKTVLLDIDNTLVSAHTSDPDQRVFDLICRIKESGIEPIIYSNNTKKRVLRFAKDLNIKVYYWSFKPLIFVYLKIFKENNLNRNEVFSIGDQLVTDIFGSHVAKIYAIYSYPLYKEEGWTTHINRFFERLLFKYVVK